jgi:hypothetical protein
LPTEEREVSAVALAMRADFSLLAALAELLIGLLVLYLRPWHDGSFRGRSLMKLYSANGFHTCRAPRWPEA